MRRGVRIAAALAFVAVMSVSTYAVGDGSGDPTAVKRDDGKWSDKNGNPTFKVDPNGTVDWYTYTGYLRYSSECLRCHGPDGMGSSYAPALYQSLKRLSYSEFYTIVAGGKQDVGTAQQLVMPANGLNKNVMCFIDDIFIYLRARANGAVGRGRPEKHAPKPASYTKAEDTCMG
jgi:methanol metabolism-related c-type cytochrome